jgi:hypothetical protein
MKCAYGFTPFFHLVIVYIGFAPFANAQVIDSSAQISNQIDSNIIQVLTTPNLGPVPLTSPESTSEERNMTEAELQKAISTFAQAKKDFLNSVLTDSVQNDRLLEFAKAAKDSPLSGKAVQLAVDSFAPGAVTDSQVTNLINILKSPTVQQKLALETIAANPSAPTMHIDLGGNPSHPQPLIPHPVNEPVTWKDYGEIYVNTKKSDFIDSKFTDTPATWGAELKQSPIIVTGIFNEKNSFVGKGLTDTYTGQVGWSYQTPFALTIQPSLTYQEANTDLGGLSSFNSNTYGCSVNLALKVFPIEAITMNQPAAAYNLAPTKLDKPCPYEPWTIPDQYPSCDLLVNLNGGFNDANTETNVFSHWVYSTQDNYSVIPGLTFDYYNQKTSDGFGTQNDWTCLLPSSVTFSPSFTDVLTENQMGQSASAGFLSLSERNLYLFTLDPSHDYTDCDQAPSESVSVVQINTLNHDTNQEGLIPPSGHVEYQNWATFGLALIYAKAHPKPDPNSPKKGGVELQVPTAKVEYDYVAFNNQYEGHTVTVTVNFKFW